MRKHLGIVVLLTGCGRIGFDASEDATLNCIAGYSASGGSCYRIEQQDHEWLDCELRCEADGPGAHMVSIESATELATVRSLTATFQDIWIGTSDRRTTETYLTVTGRPAYLDWDTGQPDDNGGPEYCLNLTLGLMHDDDCSSLNDTVCEYDGTPPAPSAF